jgi:hypothetical protein
MEKENEESLIKIRSARAAVAAGFRLYTGNFRRIFRSTWMFQLPFAVVSGVVEALLVIYYPILVLAFMLLWYVVYRFLMRRRLTMLPAVGAPLSVYLHHPGQIIVVALVTFLACAGLWLLTSIPAVILGIANIQAATGVLYGDPLGMPDYMLWLTMGVFTLSSLMQAYIYLAYFFPVRYAQGSTVATEAERQSQLKQNK